MKEGDAIPAVAVICAVLALIFTNNGHVVLGFGFMSIMLFLVGYYARMTFEKYKEYKAT